RNRYVSAWKQLAASLGLAGLPLTQVAGKVTMAMPRFDFDKASARVLSQHTDVRTAANAVQKAQYVLNLARAANIPDIDVRVAILQDASAPPHGITPSVTVGVPIPLWNQNQGGILQAQGGLLRASEESHRVRTDLSQKLADAFERYDNNKHLLEHYRDR